MEKARARDKAGVLSYSVPSATSAATTTATATAVAAPASSTPASSAARPAATAATAALRHWTRFVHHERAAQEILTVANSDRALPFGVILKVDKTETARLAGEAIANNLNRVSTETRSCQPVLQFCFGGLVRQIPYKQSFQKSSLGPNCRFKDSGHSQSTPGGFPSATVP